MNEVEIINELVKLKEEKEKYLQYEESCINTSTFYNLMYEVSALSVVIDLFMNKKLGGQ